AAPFGSVTRPLTVARNSCASPVTANKKRQSKDNMGRVFMVSPSFGAYFSVFSMNRHAIKQRRSFTRSDQYCPSLFQGQAKWRYELSWNCLQLVMNQITSFIQHRSDVG